MTKPTFCIGYGIAQIGFTNGYRVDIMNLDDCACNKAKNPSELLTLSASYDVEVSIFKGAKLVTKEVFSAADGAYLPNVMADDLPTILTKVQGL